MSLLKRQVRRIERKGSAGTWVGLPLRRPALTGLIGRIRWHERLHSQVSQTIHSLENHKSDIIAGDPEGIQPVKFFKLNFGELSAEEREHHIGLRDLNRLLKKRLFVWRRGVNLNQNQRIMNKALVDSMESTLQKIQEENSRRLSLLREYKKP